MERYGALVIERVSHEEYGTGGVLKLRANGYERVIPYTAGADADAVVRMIVSELTAAMGADGAPANAPQIKQAPPADGKPLFGGEFSIRSIAVHEALADGAMHVEWQIGNRMHTTPIVHDLGQRQAIMDAVAPVLQAFRMLSRQDTDMRAAKATADANDGNAADPLPLFRSRICGDKCAPHIGDSACAAICVRALSYAIDELERAGLALADAAGKTAMDSDYLAEMRYQIRQAAANADALAHGNEPKLLTADD